MKGNLRTAIAVVSFFTAAAVQAAPVSLGTIEHLYGTDSGRQFSSIMDIYHPGGNCDTANASSLTVKATSASSCNRFADAFDFSGISYDSIDHFTITLGFSNARNQVFGVERWNALGGYNYTHGGDTLGTLNASGPQSFTFDSSDSRFANVLDTEQFFLFFSTSLGSSMQFDLSSARLELFGTPGTTAVPEPGPLALISLSLLALGAVRRTRRSGDRA